MSKPLTTFPPQREAVPAVVDKITWRVETARALGNHARADMLLDRRDALVRRFWAVRRG